MPRALYKGKRTGRIWFMEDKVMICKELGYICKKINGGEFLDRMCYEKSCGREFCVIYGDGEGRKRIDITGMKGIQIIQRVIKEFEPKVKRKPLATN